MKKISEKLWHWLELVNDIVASSTLLFVGMMIILFVAIASYEFWERVPDCHIGLALILSCSIGFGASGAYSRWKKNGKEAKKSQMKLIQPSINRECVYTLIKLAKFALSSKTYADDEKVWDALWQLNAARNTFEHNDKVREAV